MLIRTVDQLSQDVRNGIRALRRGRGVTTTAVLTLALGIGANTAIFSVAYAWLLREWQVREPARLAFVRARGADGERIDDFMWQTVDQLRLSTRTMTTLSAFDGSTVAVTIDGKSAVVYADFVTGDYFSLLDLQTPLGRPLTRDDDQPGRPPVAVISHAYWRQQFAADPNVIGKTVVLKDLVCTIVGVTSPTYFGRKTAGTAAALMLPMTWHPALGLKDHTTFELLGRLRPDVTREAARSELDGIYQRILTEERASTAVDPTHAPAPSHIELQSATRGAMEDYDRFGREVWILQLAAGLVLLLAAVNVASLQLARGAGRQRELATRLALGATRARLIRQLLAESLLLSAAGGLLGLGLAQWGADALLVLTRGAASASVDSPVVQTPIVAFTLALILVAAMLCGVMPALRLTRADQTSGMSTSLRTRTGDRVPRVRQSLIVVQVALSIVLLVPAGLLIRTINQLARVDLGYDPTRILLMSIYPTLGGYEGAREMQVYAELMDRLNALPGIDVASFSRFSLMRRARWHGMTIHADREIIDPNVSFVVDAAAPRFFAALGLRLREGRDFSAGDTSQSARVVIVNEALAHRYFTAGQAVGRSIEFEGLRREIIGVVSDVRFEPRGARAVPAAYIAYTQAPPDMLGQMNLKIRTTGAPQAMIPAIRAELQRVAPTLPIAFVNTASATIASDSDVEASLAILVTASGVVALFLAMVGLYGSMMQAVTQRTREIGVRLALGAQPREVTGMILREVGLLVLLGVAIGVPFAWGAAHVVGSFLFDVGPANPVTAVLCCLLVTSVCLSAALLPARRAAGVDPLIALQHE